MIIIGHRGARGLAPENTLAALQKGVEYHVDELEIDIRITSDDIPVLHHDRTVSINGTTMLIANHSLASLQSLKSDFATLGDALVTINNRVALYIEVKHGEPTEPVIRVVRHFTERFPDAKLLFGSKSHKVLKELHAALPAIPTVVIEPWSGVRARYRARQLGTKRISMRSWWLWCGFNKAMYKRGYLLTPYTMNDPKKVAKWQPYLYGVITDRPDLFDHSSSVGLKRSV